jgi:hypothetical protein
MTTVHVSIGNSDDKLSQREWSEFTRYVAITMRLRCEEIHGEWYSLPNSRWQNACVVGEVHDDRLEALRSELSTLRATYGQDAVAWLAGSTAFI